MAKDKQTDAFVSALFESGPEFASTAAQEVSYYGELLPHVLMGTFTRWLIETYRCAVRGDLAARDLFERALAFLDAQLRDQSRPAVQELISVSFLENLHQAGSDLEGLKRHLGPHLRIQLERYEGTHLN